MSTEENKDVARRWNSDEFWSMELLAEDYVNRSGTKEPWAVGIDGLAEARGVFAQRRQRYPTLRVTVEDMIAEGDKVALRLVFYEGDKPTANAMAFYRLRDGKIVDDWFCATELDK